MFQSYFKIAWRYLVRNRIYTTINILGLALGISACLVIYLVSSFELSYDRFHPDNDRIYRAVSSHFEPGYTDWSYFNNISLAASHIIKDECPYVDQIANFYSYHASVTVPSEKRKGNNQGVKYEQAKAYDMIIAEPPYFSIFRYTWLAGTPTTALDQPFKVVLTESRARKYFGDIPLNQIISKELIYDDSLHLIVSGIVKDWDKNTDLNFKDFISFSSIATSFLKNATGIDDPNKPDSWGERRYSQTFIKLQTGFGETSFNDWVAKMLKNRRPLNMQGENFKVDLQPLATLHFDTRYGDYYSRQAHLPTIYALMGIAAFILIIAVINFINLSTAQSMRRAKEIGIRKVLGSYRIGIILQFLSETGVVVFFAMILSIIIFVPVLRGFREFIPADFGTWDVMNASTIIFLIIIAVFSIVFAGLYPAIILSSFAPVLSLKGQVEGDSSQKHYLRKSLIVFQFAVSLFFIIATIVVGRQIHYMLNKDLGFTKDAIVNINLDEINPNLQYTDADNEIFAGKIRKLAGVSMVSLNARPVASHFNGKSRFKDIEKGTEFAFPSRFGDENYVPLYGLKIIDGRNIRMPKNGSLAEFLINESCVKQLGYKKSTDAIGHLMAVGPWTGPIVGVLADFYSESLQAPIAPLFIMATKKFTGTMSVKMVSSENQSDHYKTIISNIEKIWKGIYPTEKFELSFFNEDIARFYDEEQRELKIMNTAMTISIFISCMGLFGLATLTAQQRVREIGIRKVLGASVTGIVTMLTKQFLKLVIVSIIIASPVAWYFMYKWLEDYSNRINISIWVFIMAGTFAIIIAIITVGYQAVKAATVNPVKSLRTE